MIKKFLVSSAISALLLTAAVPAFAASNCPLKNGTANNANTINSQVLSQYLNKVKASNATNAKKKCNKNKANQTDIQSLINSMLQNLGK
ncbi:MAG: hypothetical protein ACM3UU_08850 [Ignavibacteriales bacterium]